MLSISKSSIREHASSYQSILSDAPGLLCLKSLLEQEDSKSPSKAVLNKLLAPDFRDFENAGERSKSRDDVIQLILTRALCYSQYQTDLIHAWCLPNTTIKSTQTVLYESLRFVLFHGDKKWIRIAVAGRLEVRCTSGRGGKQGEITLRRLTLDLNQFWKRKAELSPPQTLLAPTSSPQPQRRSVYELPDDFVLSSGRPSPRHSPVPEEPVQVSAEQPQRVPLMAPYVPVLPPVIEPGPPLVVGASPPLPRGHDAPIPLRSVLADRLSKRLSILGDIFKTRPDVVQNPEQTGYDVVQDQEETWHDVVPDRGWSQTLSYQQSAPSSIPYHEEELYTHM
ncbi:hypothetical protein GP486_003873 [Trichoglossum hirsutum]|uniref:Uncharacterized protein n=1 Tax=Trichoglossum hirsutum TaxID=265104 RepID=A0A9P8LC84_9PEZI|nr:hypothetical protein GP486_003873 [Trichoglossum hirsutum]